MRASRSSHRGVSVIESLEGRQLLTYTTHIMDPSQGMVDSETKTAGYRAQMVEVPQVAADGTITVKGTAVDDVITVTRVTDPTADKNDGEYDFAIYTDANGQKIWESGGIDQYVDSDFLASERAEMATYVAQRDAALAAGNPVPASVTQEISDFQQRISMGETFLNKFESGKFIRITLNGIYDWFYELGDEQAAHAKIVINGGAGKDDIEIAKDVPLQASINGEAGSDTLVSGKRVARLYGGNGNDKLVSRSTKAGTLDGGKGADRYYSTSSTANIDVRARADGDRVATPAGMMLVLRPGTFGTIQINRKPNGVLGLADA